MRFCSQGMKFWEHGNTLGWVQKDAEFCKLCKEGAKMLVVLLGGMAKNKDIVYVGKAEI